jgi:hypothetical protein
MKPKTKKIVTKNPICITCNKPTSKVITEIGVVFRCFPCHKLYVENKHLYKLDIDKAAGKERDDLQDAVSSREQVSRPETALPKNVEQMIDEIMQEISKEICEACFNHLAHGHTHINSVKTRKALRQLATRMMNDEDVKYEKWLENRVELLENDIKKAEAKGRAEALDEAIKIDKSKIINESVLFFQRDFIREYDIRKYNRVLRFAFSKLHAELEALKSKPEAMK